MKVAYDSGGQDDRELSAADLKAAGVEGFHKTVFPKGQAVEVSDEVGEALLNHELFDGFSEVDDDESADDEDTNPAPDDKAAAKEAAARQKAASGTSSGSVAAPAAGSTASVSSSGTDAASSTGTGPT